jgi:hypothetical protein
MPHSQGIFNIISVHMNIKAVIYLVLWRYSPLRARALQPTAVTSTFSQTEVKEHSVSLGPSINYVTR